MPKKNPRESASSADTPAVVIRARREAANLTQSALARALGCADTMISRWESGRVVPRLKYAEKLAAALGGVAGDYRAN